MKHRIIYLGMILLSIFSFNGQAMQNEELLPKGPYLGQKPPDMTPEIFAPGIISSEEFVDFKVSFSLDGNEYYFYRLSYPSDERYPALSTFQTPLKMVIKIIISARIYRAGSWFDLVPQSNFSLKNG